MKKKEALNIMNSFVSKGVFDPNQMGREYDIENQIRILADKDESFENTVFELGCSVMAKQYMKKNVVTIKERFNLIGLEWRILGFAEEYEGYVCLAESMGESVRFDDICNNWKESTLRKYLNTEVLKKISEEIGAENVINFERDLISHDGVTEYGKCMDEISLISMDEYRKYRGRIPNSGDWWWTLTPDSTECNGDTKYATVVSPSGNFNYGHYYDDCGVRPFCILNPCIFESLKTY